MGRAGSAGEKLLQTHRRNSEEERRCDLEVEMIESQRARSLLIIEREMEKVKRTLRVTRAVGGYSVNPAPPTGHKDQAAGRPPQEERDGQDEGNDPSHWSLKGEQCHQGEGGLDKSLSRSARAEEIPAKRCVPEASELATFGNVPSERVNRMETRVNCPLLHNVCETSTDPTDSLEAWSESTERRPGAKESKAGRRFWRTREGSLGNRDKAHFSLDPRTGGEERLYLKGKGPEFRKGKFAGSLVNPWDGAPSPLDSRGLQKASTDGCKRSEYKANSGVERTLLVRRTDPRCKSVSDGPVMVCSEDREAGPSTKSQIKRSLDFTARSLESFATVWRPFNGRCVPFSDHPSAREKGPTSSHRVNDVSPTLTRHSGFHQPALRSPLIRSLSAPSHSPHVLSAAPRFCSAREPGRKDLAECPGNVDKIRASPSVGRRSSQWRRQLSVDVPVATSGPRDSGQVRVVMSKWEKARILRQMVSSYNRPPDRTQHQREIQRLLQVQIDAFIAGLVQQKQTGSGIRDSQTGSGQRYN